MKHDHSKPWLTMVEHNQLSSSKINHGQHKTKVTLKAWLTTVTLSPSSEPWSVEPTMVIESRVDHC